MHPKSEGPGEPFPTEALIEMLQQSAQVLFPGQDVSVSFTVDTDTHQHLARLDVKQSYSRDESLPYEMETNGATARKALLELRRRFWEEKVRPHVEDETRKINMLRRVAEPEV